MAVYGSDDGVQALLIPAAGATLGPDQMARVPDIRAAVSAAIERETGVVFGGPPAAEAVVVDAEPGPTLWLPKPVRSVAAIAEEPTWTGTAWTGGYPIGTLGYRLAGRTETGGYRTVERVGGAWAGRYVVTGLWADTTDEVPPEIAYVANYLAAETMKKLQASPAGFVGPDGLVAPVRNAFKDPEVRAVLARWRLATPVGVA